MRFQCRQQNRIGLVIVATCCALTACEQLPPMGTAHEALVENAFDSPGRGGYDWVVSRTEGFEVARRSRFTYFDRIDPEVFASAASLPLFKENALGKQPAGMDEDVYHWLRRYTEPHESTSPIFSVPVSDDVRPEGFDINASGDQLLTVGKKIQIWDIDKQQVSHSYPNLSQAVRAFLADDGSSFTTVSDDSVDLVSVPDGKTQSSWSSPAKIESVSISRDGSAYCIITRDKRMFALDKELQLIGTYRGGPVSNAFSAVHPEGKWILANTQAGPVRWHIERADLSVEKLTAPHYDPRLTRCESGVHEDRWIGQDFANVFQGEKWICPTTDENSEKTFQLLPRIIWTQDCTVDGSQSWSLVLGEQVDVHNQLRVILLDIAVSDSSWSERIFLNEIPLSIATDRSGERIVLSNLKAVRVIRRRRWVDPFGDWTVGKVQFLFLAGRLQQVELFTEELRQQPRFRYNITGESMFTRVIEGLGAEWSKLELNQNDPDLLKNIVEWHAAGGTLARAASVSRHVNSAWAARGSGYASSVTRQGQRTFAARLADARNELVDILALDRPPAYAFSAMLNIMKATGRRHLDAERYLERYVTLYPNDTVAHLHMGGWLLPKWGGDSGDSGAYYSKLADAYPESYSDLFFARNALRLQTTLGPRDRPQTHFSMLRLKRGGLQMLELGYLTPLDTGFLIGFSIRNKDHAMTERLEDYYARQFTTLITQYYDSEAYEWIYEARQRAFEFVQAKPTPMLPN